MVGRIDVLQEFPELAVDARHRRGRHAGDRARRQRRDRLAPGNHAPAPCRPRCSMSTAFLSGTRILMFFSPSTIGDLDLEVQILRRPRHDVEDLLVVARGDLLVFGPHIFVQHLQFVAWSRRGTGMLSTPMNGSSPTCWMLRTSASGTRPSRTARRCSGPLKPSWPPAFTVIVDRAAGLLLDLLGEGHGVLGVEIAVRPHRRQSQLHRRRACARVGALAGRQHRHRCPP